MNLHQYIVILLILSLIFSLTNTHFVIFIFVSYIPFIEENLSRKPTTTLSQSSTYSLKLLCNQSKWWVDYHFWWLLCQYGSKPSISMVPGWPWKILQHMECKNILQKRRYLLCVNWFEQLHNVNPFKLLFDLKNMNLYLMCKQMLSAARLWQT